MGIEKRIEISSKLSKPVDLYRPPALRQCATSTTDITKNNSFCNQMWKSPPFQPQNDLPINVQSHANQTERPLRRERRPDRAVYIPRPRRSQTTPPHLNSAASSESSEIIYSTAEIDQNEIRVLINSCNERNLDPQPSNNVLSNCYSKKSYENLNRLEGNPDCNLTTNLNFTLVDSCNNISLRNSSSIKDTNLKNLNNCNMDEINDKISQNNFSRIEDAVLLSKDSKENKEIEELERVSKEINRGSRRIMKQTFQSDVLEIPDSNFLRNDGELICNEKREVIDPASDDWDSMFDDNGERVDPKIISELTACVGRVQIELPKSDYKLYHMKQLILNEEEYPHVLEISNFPVEFKTHDLMMIFSAYKESGFEIKWVDDTHALAVFSNSRIAAEVLALGHPFVQLKPLADATMESRSKARKCASSMQPYRPRPETCAALARRLVTGALGVRLKTATEERENEKRVLRQAKERKILEAKQRDEVWES